MYDSKLEDVEVQEKIQYQEIKQEYEPQDIKIWDDFNSKNSVWEMISSDFVKIKKLSDKTVIKRNDAKSPHSGYIYHDKDFLYLWSTGTQYPAQKALRPFDLYAIQKHYGNIKLTCSDLYKQGYGSRMKKQIQQSIKKIQPKAEVKETAFPIDIYPDFIQRYIFPGSCIPSITAIQNSISKLSIG
jgi:predicted GTPase